MKPMVNKNAVCIFDGPSRIDGQRVIVLVSGLSGKGSANGKTGPMLQAYILLADIGPVDGVRQGLDSGICGDCPHRGVDGFKGRSCYVNVGQGPRSVWASWYAGNVRTVSPADLAPVLRHRGLRLGAYGDPAAVPVEVWEPMIRAAAYHTGYTHQWANPIGESLRPYVMASCDNPEQLAAAESAGWRGFLVVGAEDPAPKMRRCPSDPSLSSVPVSCSVCRACDGSESDRQKGSRWIRAHGTGRKYFGLKMATV